MTWKRISLEINERSAKRSMSSRKGKGHNSPNYLGVKKVGWKVKKSDGGWAVFRKLFK